MPVLASLCLLYPSTFENRKDLRAPPSAVSLLNCFWKFLAGVD
jgi:hypothetical protein